MDGFQGGMKQSLQFRLSVWLALIILVVAVIAGGLSFTSAFQEAIELQDDQLRQMAALIDRQHLPLAQTALHANVQTDDSESRVVAQLLRKDDAEAPEPPGELRGLSVNLPDGFQTVIVQHRSWRLFVRTLSSGSRVAVGQRTAVRDEIARDGAQWTLMPFVVLIPILLLMVGVLIRKMFKPLEAAARDLDRRVEQDLHEIVDARLPSEIRPFIVAINRLLSRVARSVATQRRFVADAAHELRSPLTVLSLQAERLQAMETPPQIRERLVSLRHGIERMRRLLDQLLSLAREQACAAGQTETVSLQQVFRQTLEDLMPLAQAKNIDLGAFGEADAEVRAQASDLKTLIKNLVDNAIRYTPEGGRIDFSVQSRAGKVVVQIADTGPGIPAEERDRVFDPFYRLFGNDETGAGLGLSIVQTIARRIGAQISLGYADERACSGLCVSVVFPAVEPEK